MYQLRNFLTDSRFLSFIGVAAVATFFFLGAKTLQIAMLWAAMASLAILILWGSVWFYRRRKSRRASGATGRPSAPIGARACRSITSAST